MGRWFYTGNLMSDGKTKRSIFAADEVQIQECIDKGWIEVGGQKEVVVEKKEKPKKTDNITVTKKTKKKG